MRQIEYGCKEANTTLGECSENMNSLPSEKVCGDVCASQGSARVEVREKFSVLDSLLPSLRGFQTSDPRHQACESRAFND